MPRILIVDDEPSSLKLFCRVLGPPGFDVHPVSSGAEALLALREDRDFDVVLSDLWMPGLDGVQLLREVRSEFQDRPWLQFVMVSGNATLDSAVRAIHGDACGYLFKPIVPRDLIATVKQAAKRAAEARAAVRPTLPADGAGSSDAELSQLTDTVRVLVRRLREQPHLPPAPAMSPAGPRTEAELLQSLVRMQEMRARTFGESVTGEPSWEMLTELMLAKLSGRRVSVTSVCLASKARVTTALRRLEELVDQGFVLRIPDPRDRRRTNLQISEEGERRMRAFLAEMSRMQAAEGASPSRATFRHAERAARIGPRH